MEHRFGQRTVVDTTVAGVGVAGVGVAGVGEEDTLRNDPRSNHSKKYSFSGRDRFTHIRGDGNRNEEALSHVIITEFTSFQLPS